MPFGMVFKIDNMIKEKSSRNQYKIKEMAGSRQEKNLNFNKFKSFPWHTSSL